MDSYTKLFSSIVTSTIWQEDLPTKVLWITMLAISDSEGHVMGSIPGLANLSGITIKQCENSINKLSNPDQYSRTKDHDGRRIQEIEGGWLIINRVKYRDKKVSRREYMKRYMKEYRTENNVNNSVNNVSICKQKLAQEEEEIYIKEKTQGEILQDQINEQRRLRMMNV